MTIIVPFDGSVLARSALCRAVEFGVALEETVLAVSVIPVGNREYARDRGWIGPTDEFEIGPIVESLYTQVTHVAPRAEFRRILVDRYAPPGTIANRIRRFAKAHDASLVCIGSDNAGHMVTSLGSVGGSVAADHAYDVVIVKDRTHCTAVSEPESKPEQRQTLREN